MKIVSFINYKGGVGKSTLHDIAKSYVGLFSKAHVVYPGNDL